MCRAAADLARHAVGGGDREQFVQQAADLLLVRAALEERNRLALEHGDGGGNGLHLEGLRQLREGFDVRSAEDQPAAVALDDPVKRIQHAGGFRRIGGPEGKHHGHLGGQLHKAPGSLPR